MFLCCRSENLGLHSRSNNPKRICDDVTKEATYTSGERVQLERIFIPAVGLFEMNFGLFIQRKVYSMEERYAKDRHRVPYKQYKKLMSRSLY